MAFERVEVKPPGVKFRGVGLGHRDLAADRVAEFRQLPLVQAPAIEEAMVYDTHRAVPVKGCERVLRIRAVRAVLHVDRRRTRIAADPGYPVCVSDRPLRKASSVVRYRSGKIRHSVIAVKRLLQPFRNGLVRAAGEMRD